jgi:hypothetical protein
MKFSGQKCLENNNNFIEKLFFFFKKKNYLNIINEYMLIVLLAITFFFWDIKTEFLTLNIKSLALITIFTLSIINYKSFFNKKLKFILFILLFFVTHYILNLVYFIFNFKLNDLFYLFVICSYFLFINFYLKKIKKIFFLFLTIFLFIPFAQIILNLRTILAYLNDKYIFSYDQSCSLSSFFGPKIWTITNFEFFTEASHYGMIYCGVFNYFYFKKLSTKFCYLLCLSFLLSITFFASATLYFGLLITSIIASIIIILNVEIKKKLLIKSLLLILVSLILIISNPNCHKRITNINTLSLFNLEYKNFKEEIKDPSKEEIKDLYPANITSDVYKKSLILTIRALKSNIFGFGLNRFEDFHKIEIKNIKNDYDLQKNKIFFGNEGLELNWNDGRSNLSKLLIEFGIFSFILLIIFIIFSFDKKIPFDIKIFFNSVVIIQLFSGAGYINCGFLFSVCFVTILINKNYRKN